MKTVAATPPTFLLAALLLMLALHCLVPGTRIIQPPWNLLGLLPLGFGVGINLAADRELHRAGTTVKPFEVSATLVSGGVYRFSRHPMYLGFTAVLAGLAVLLGSLIPWLVVPAFFLLLERTFIRVEEDMLAERFGEDWRAYTGRVRRWF